MLKELLQGIVEAGGVVATGQLARALGVSVGLVEEMIERLGRLGYLAPVDSACAGSCSRCSQRGVCAIPSQARLWTLTDKGRQAVKQEAAASALEPSTTLQ
jgi:hypothetical protein